MALELWNKYLSTRCESIDRISFLICCKLVFELMIFALRTFSLDEYHQFYSQNWYLIPVNKWNMTIFKSVRSYDFKLSHSKCFSWLVNCQINCQIRVWWIYTFIFETSHLKACAHVRMIINEHASILDERNALQNNLCIKSREKSIQIKY